MFNQVGLIAINALGDELGDLSIPSRKGLPPRLENELEFDPVTNERLKQLFMAKEKAVENEDFDEAKKLREAIDRLRSVGQQLLHLEERKRTAINDENYESAKVIKMEIDRLRNAVVPPTENNYFARPYSGKNESFNQPRPLSRPLQQIVAANEYETASKQPKPDFSIKADPFSSRNNQVLPGKPSVSFDEQVIPTVLHGKAPGQVFEDENDGVPKNSSKSPEPLGLSQSKNADPFIDILGEPLCKKIFSKT